MVLFSVEEKKIIAEFYKDNYKTLTGDARKPEINSRRNRLYENLALELNSINPDVKKSVAQIKSKLQEMNRITKEKVVISSSIIRKTGGGKPPKALDAVEEILASQMSSTASYKGIPGGGIQSGVANFSKSKMPFAECYQSPSTEPHSYFLLSDSKESSFQAFSSPDSQNFTTNTEPSLPFRKRLRNKNEENDIVISPKVRKLASTIENGQQPNHNSSNNVRDLQVQALQLQIAATEEFRRKSSEFFGSAKQFFEMASAVCSKLEGH